MITPELLQILACPTCKGELTLSEAGFFLQCEPCGCDYPVIEGIPVLLPEGASTVLLSKCEAP